jgi:COP9 signalosome complex subunit 3
MSPDSTLSQLLAFPPHPPPQQPLSIRQYESGIKTLLKFLEGLTASKLTAPISGKDTLLDVRSDLEYLKLHD